MTEDASNPVEQAIRERRTRKTLAEQPLPVSDRRCLVDELISSAGWAPFHRPSDALHRHEDLCSIVPWRFHALDARSCRRLRQILSDRGDSSKIPAMLAAADALIQVTWLPDPAPQGSPGLFDPSLRNMEHIAASSAAVQNLLLAATARGIASYWSSGGALRQDDVFALLGIPAAEILLGSVFLFPVEPESAVVRPGALRDQRGEVGDWARWVELD